MQDASNAARLRALASRVRSFRTWVFAKRQPFPSDTRDTLPIDIGAHARARVGTVLRGKYRLERVLGVGGMASVYVATHRNRRRFAVKILHPQLSFDAEVRARFQREGWLANTVDHRGVVAVLDDDVSEDGSAFLVMELLDGESLDVLWERHRTLPLPIALALADQLLEVLRAAHARGVLHRDIKPANLFLTRDGILKVLDFGIARMREKAGAASTQIGVALGTPGFMPPEQAAGSWSEIGTDADLWAVGATLYSFASGRYVHEGKTPQELLFQASSQPAPPLATVAADVAPPIARVVDRALSFRKQDRYTSASAMRRALQQAHLEAFEKPLDASPQTLATWLEQQSGVPARLDTRERERVIRRRWWLFVAVVLLIAALVFGISFDRLRWSSIQELCYPAAHADASRDRLHLL